MPIAITPEHQDWPIQSVAQRCTQDCIQVHGGIGFTWEHDTNATTAGR